MISKIEAFTIRSPRIMRVGISISCRVSESGALLFIPRFWFQFRETDGVSRRSSISERAAITKS